MCALQGKPDEIIADFNIDLLKTETPNYSLESSQTFHSYCLTPTLDKATCVGNNLATITLHSKW